MNNGMQRSARLLAGIAVLGVFAIACTQPAPGRSPMRRQAAEVPRRGERSATPVAAGTAPPGRDVTRFLKDDETVVTTTTGDVNGDGVQDVLAVLDRGDPMRGRTLLVAVGSSDGTLSEAARGELAVLCGRCGGLAGDPLSALTASGKGFDLRFEGGSREQWARRFHFDWMPASTSWRLTGYFTRVVDTVTGQVDERQQDAPDVSLEQFDAAHFID